MLKRAKGEKLHNKKAIVLSTRSDLTFKAFSFQTFKSCETVQYYYLL